MELSTSIFKENLDGSSSEKIIQKIKKGDWNDIYKGICYINNKSLVCDYIYFKHFATNETYNIIQMIITNNIDNILINSNNFNVYINMKNLTITEMDKHKNFIQHIANLLKEKYPDKLCKCYVYNAPFVFSHFFRIISMFIDKETLTKIELINKS